MAWAGGTGFGGTVVSIYTVRTRWKSNRWPIVIFCVSVSSVLFSSCCFLSCRCFFLFTFFAFLWASLENHHKRLIWDIGWFSVRAQLRVVSIPWVPIPGPNLTRPADNAAIATSIHSHHFSSWIGTNITKYCYTATWTHLMYLHYELLTFNSSRCFVLFRIILSVEIPQIPHCVNSFKCSTAPAAAIGVGKLPAFVAGCPRPNDGTPMSTWPEAFEKVIKSSGKNWRCRTSSALRVWTKTEQGTASKGHTAPCSWASSGCSLINGQPYGSIWQVETLG